MFLFQIYEETMISKVLSQTGEEMTRRALTQRNMHVAKVLSWLSFLLSFFPSLGALSAS
jgi:hypothetical protein